MRDHYTKLIPKSEYYIHKVALLAILLLALWLRLYHLDNSMWGDEIYTILDATPSISSIIENRPYPVAYVLTHFILSITDSETVIRLFFISIGICSLVAVYFLGKTAKNERTGLFLALLLALSTTHIQISHDIRFYGLVMLFGVLGLLFLLKYHETNKFIYLVLLISFLLLSVYSHTTAIFYVVGVFAGYASYLGYEFYLNQSWDYKKTIYFLSSIFVFGLLMPPMLQSSMFGMFLKILPIQKNSEPIGTNVVEKTYRLDFKQYLNSYAFQEWLVWDNLNWVLLGVMLLFLIIGALYLAINNKLFFSISLYVLLIMPFLCGFLEVNHFWASRYFINNMTILTAILAVGIVCTIEFIMRLKWPYKAPGLLAIILLVFFCVVRPRHAEIQAYEKEQPRIEMKKAVDIIATLGKEEDRLLWDDSSRLPNVLSAVPFAYYYNQKTSNSLSPPFHYINNLSEISKHSTKHKQTWLITDKSKKELNSFSNDLFLRSIGNGKYSAYKLVLLKNSTKYLPDFSRNDSEFFSLLNGARIQYYKTLYTDSVIELYSDEKLSPTDFPALESSLLHEGKPLMVLPANTRIILDFVLSYKHPNRGKRGLHAFIKGEDETGNSIWKEIYTERGFYKPDWRKVTINDIIDQDIYNPKIGIRLGRYPGQALIAHINLQLKNSSDAPL